MHTVPHVLPLPLASEALQRLAWGGATLDERVAAYAGLPLPPPDAPVRGRLSRWAKLFASGDAAALERRLSWDGLSPDSLAGALSDSPPQGWAAEWPVRLGLVLNAAAAMATEVGDSRWEQEIEALGGTKDLPFADAWLPLVRVARGALDGRVSTRLASTALDAFARQLALDLSRAGSLVLLDAFTAFRRGMAAEAATGRATYLHFVRHLLAGGLQTLFLDYPALARRCVYLVDACCEGVTELGARLDADSAAIAEVFGWQPMRVVSARPGLSDPHAGWRRVVALEFDDGRKLVYKPRDLGLEAAFNELLAWCRGAGLADVPSPVPTLDRGTHGWVEFVEPGVFADPGTVRSYYRRAGGLLCLGHLLRSIDLHAENIVAACTGPVVVDGEVMLQPRRPSEGTGPGDLEEHDAGAERDGVYESCLASGLLSLRHRDPRGDYYEAGGLREAGKRVATVPRRAWHGLRSDEIGFALVDEYVPAVANVVRVNGQTQRPDDFAEDLVDGFQEAYRFILASRDRFAGVSGPLERFRGRAARLLLRASDPYGALLEVLNAAPHWRCGVDRSISLDSINRPFNRQAAAPALWPLAGDERRALERGDVPRFTLRTDAPAPRASSGAVASGFYSQSGYDAVSERVASMSEADLARQLAWLHGALRADSRPARPAVEGGGEWLAAGLTLGSDLLARAAAGPRGGLTWPVLGERLDLYGGYGGIAVLFAALARLEGGRWRTAARGVLSTIDQQLDADGVRWATQTHMHALPSLVYALTLASWLLDDTAPLDRARSLAHECRPDRLATLRDYDVTRGLAGALLAFVALAKASGDEHALACARECAARLVARQEARGQGRAWRSPDGGFRTGFGHGASGAAYALARYATLAESSGGPALAAAHTALDWEASMFSPRDRNWPAIRGDGGASIMTGWCHGAAGIALALALWPSASRDRRVPDLLRQALAATVAAAPARQDHPCCGTFARVDALLAAAEATGDASWREAATALARPVAARVISGGAAAARTGGFEYGLFQPGFFQGVSGIAYGLLRVGEPCLPSVAGFAMPDWRP